MLMTGPEIINIQKYAFQIKILKYTHCPLLKITHSRSHFCLKCFTVRIHRYFSKNKTIPVIERRKQIKFQYCTCRRFKLFFQNSGLDTKKQWSYCQHKNRDVSRKTNFEITNQIKLPIFLNMQCQASLIRGFWLVSYKK